MAQFKVNFTRELYPDIPTALDELETLTGIVTRSQITAIAIREMLKDRQRQKELEARRERRKKAD